MCKIFRNITGVVILLFILSGKIASCPTVSDFIVNPTQVPVGESVSFSATINPQTDQTIVGWTLTVDGLLIGGGAGNLDVDSVVFLTSGKKTAILSVTWQDKDGNETTQDIGQPQTFYVYRVKTVTSNKNALAKGSTEKITLKVALDPDSVTSVPDDAIEWQRQKDGGGWEDCGTGMSKDLNANEVGVYKYQARAGDGDVWVEAAALYVYSVTIGSITPGYLVKGKGGSAKVEFTVAPDGYSPVKGILYAGSDNWTLTGFSGGGNYSTFLIEGTDLPAAGSYSVKITVDNAVSNIESVTVFGVSITGPDAVFLNKSKVMSASITAAGVAGNIGNWKIVPGGAGGGALNAANGTFTANNIGAVNMTVDCTVGTVTATSDVFTVTVFDIGAIAIAPPQKILYIGGAQDFSVTITDTNGIDRTIYAIEYLAWSIENDVAAEVIGSLNALQGVQVTFTATGSLPEGKAEITGKAVAKIGNVSGNAIIKVRTLAANLLFNNTIDTSDDNVGVNQTISVTINVSPAEYSGVVSMFTNNNSKANFGGNATIDVNIENGSGTFNLLGRLASASKGDVKITAAIKVNNVSVSIGNGFVTVFNLISVGQNQKILYANGGDKDYIRAEIIPAIKDINVNYWVSNVNNPGTVLGSINPLEETTGSNGLALSRYTSGNSTGADYVRAKIKGTGLQDYITMYNYDGYNMHNIGDNATDYDDDMFSAISMDETQIQDYLELRGSCLATFEAGGRRASKIIYDAAKEKNVNSKIILAALQTEKSLIMTGGTLDPTSPAAKLAMGYDKDHPSDFVTQIYGGADTYMDGYNAVANFPAIRTNVGYLGTVVYFNVNNRSTNAQFYYDPVITGRKLFVDVWQMLKRLGGGF